MRQSRPLRSQAEMPASWPSAANRSICKVGQSSRPAHPVRAKVATFKSPVEASASTGRTRLAVRICQLESRPLREVQVHPRLAATFRSSPELWSWLTKVPSPQPALDLAPVEILKSLRAI